MSLQATDPFLHSYCILQSSRVIGPGWFWSHSKRQLQQSRALNRDNSNFWLMHAWGMVIILVLLRCEKDSHRLVASRRFDSCHFCHWTWNKMIQRSCLVLSVTYRSIQPRRIIVFMQSSPDSHYGRCFGFRRDARQNFVRSASVSHSCGLFSY